jgi:hypothetical protein
VACGAAGSDLLLTATPSKVTCLACQRTVAMADAEAKRTLARSINKRIKRVKGKRETE